MEKDFFKTDLHIHTPSSTCYEGPKNDSEYLKILRRAKKADLKMIALTDHNSIAGYKKLMIDIKQGLITRKKELQKTSASKEVKKKLISVNSDLGLFEDLLILPGIEFETKDEIHLLLIFNPSTDISKIEEFLKSGGYDEINRGLENPIALAKWDVLELYEESERYECLVIDAHTDSNKGLYNHLPKGKLRANCFRSETLKAVCYKSEKQKDALNSILNSSLDYKRIAPLAFIKTSDAHSAEEIGNIFTWVKLERINFDCLRAAISNPIECISIEEPSINKILTSLITGENTFGIESLSEENKTYLKQVICGLNNAKEGYCLIGLNRNKNVIGLPISAKIIKGRNKLVIKYIDELVETIKGIDGSPQIGFNLYPLQNNRIIISIKVGKTDELASIKGDNRIYYIKDNKPEALRAVEIQKIIEERQTQSIESRIENRLNRIQQESNYIRNIFRSFPILQKFENNSDLLFNIIDNINLKTSIPLNINEQQRLERSFENRRHGIVKGNVVILKEIISPRYPYAYLRYSAPQLNARHTRKIKAKEGMYLLFGGAVFYSKKEIPIYSGGEECALYIYSRKPTVYSNKFLACFLKSSFFLWYMQCKFGVTCIVRKDIFRKIRIPIINPHIKQVKDIVASAEERLDEILEKERIFLTKKHKKENEADLSQAHNKEIDILAYEIDKLIYRLLELNQSQIEIIENILIANDIYLPKYLIDKGKEAGGN